MKDEIGRIKIPREVIDLKKRLFENIIVVAVVITIVLIFVWCLK